MTRKNQFLGVVGVFMVIFIANATVLKILLEEQRKIALIIEEQKKATESLVQISKNQKSSVLADKAELSAFEFQMKTLCENLSRDLERKILELEQKNKQLVDSIGEITGPQKKSTELAGSLEQIGDSLKKNGDLAGATNSHRESFLIRKVLAEKDKGDLRVQYDLFLSIWRLASDEFDRFNYDEAKVLLEKGCGALAPFRMTRKLNSEEIEMLGRAQESIVFFEKASVAAKDVDFAMRQPPKIVKQLLVSRARYWADKGKSSELVVTAEKLRGLADLPEAKPGGNLYDAACAYSNASTCKDANESTKMEFQLKAIEMLREARAKGFFIASKFEHAKNDPDLNPLRGLDDFKKMFDELEKAAK